MSDSDAEMSEAMRNLVRQDAEEQARQQRQQTANHQRLAIEEATFDGALLDAKEAGLVVRIVTEEDRSHRGKLVALHNEYVALSEDNRPIVLITRRAIRALEIAGAPKRSGAASSRSISNDEPDLASQLAQASETRPDIRLFVAGLREPIAATLFAVGDGMLTLARHQVDTSTMFVPLSEVSEITLLG